ncbi:TnsD family transposase [Neobacillus drentensis]|uniref:TnsD family transposase n=1 Tax=Neobacillus drentensis TaxID=220684 RepID=UPI002FFEF1DF
MISFPFLYEDELLYSAFARYHQCSGNENPKHSVEDIYGVKTVCASTTIPANLQMLCQRLPQTKINNPSFFIDKHTMLPYYAPFLQKDRYRELERVMSEDNGISIFMKLGRVASNIKSNEYLKYCYKCVTEEIKTNGEAFWHRTHQGEGVKICPKHKTWLIDSVVRYSERKHKQEFVPIELGLNVRESIKDVITNNAYEHYLFIAEQTYYLLNNKIEPLELKKLQKYYVAKVQEMGMTSVQGRIRWKELISSFSKYYGEELLQSLSCYVESGEDTWLHKLLRKPEICCHPLRHILFLGFLGETVPKIVNQIETVSYSSFGDGPWICLNKAAEHFQKPVVTSCDITRDYKTGHPIGTFSCSCGFVFSRKGPDKTNEDRYKIGRIKEFGRVWEDKLAELAQKKLSLRKMAKLLGVDPKTIKRNLNRRVDEQINITLNDNTIKFKNYRSEWAILLKNNVGKTITELRAISPRLFIWLYRNDREWLKDNYPLSEQRNIPLNGLLRVNWKKRDEEIAMKVETIVYTILSEKDNLTRVTRNEIGRRLGKLAWFLKYLDRLPKTLVIVNKSIETVEKFQIRRIKNVVRELRKTNASIKEWQVIRAAGLKKEFAESLKEVITNEIHSYPTKEEHTYVEDISV